jgi:hypothetical protein
MRPLRYQILRAVGLISFAAVSLTPNGASADAGLNRGPLGSGQFWASAELLSWRTTGMEIPPLVTGNPIGTPIDEAGIIGAPTTRIVLGNGAILGGNRPGYRLAVGGWLTCNVGMEIDYFGFSTESANYLYGANSNQIIGRPFINLAPLPAGSDPRYDTQLVTYPGIVTGEVKVSASSRLQGFGTRFIFNPLRNCCSQCLSCSSCDGCDGCGSCDGTLEPGCGLESGCDGGCQSACCPTPRCNSCDFAFSLGYRHLQLTESLQIREQLIAPDQFDLYDRFSTESRFDGLELGFAWTCQYLCFCLDTYGRLAVGRNDNNVRIAGQTTDNSSGVPITRTGGILAQSSNIGNYNQDVASAMVQLGFNGSTHVANGVSLTLGYSVLYWSNVVQAGPQVSPYVNPGLFPPQTAPLGTVGARPTHALSDFVGHGINLGLVYAF